MAAQVADLDENCPCLVHQPASLARSFYSKLGLVAESRGEILHHFDGEENPALGAPLDYWARTGDQRAYQDRQRGPQAVPKKQVSRRHPRCRQPLLPKRFSVLRQSHDSYANFRIGVLGP